MKQSPPSLLIRIFSSLIGFIFGTSFLGFLALAFTFYAYGELQNWRFISYKSTAHVLDWNTDFVEQLDRCEVPPSKLSYCMKAINRVEDWLDESAGDQSSGDIAIDLTVRGLKLRAQRLGENINPAYKPEATLKALQAWFKQIDPYSQLSVNEADSPKAPAWVLHRTRSSNVELKILNFGSINLCQQLKPVLEGLEKDQRVQALTLNLADNPGGLLEASLCFADFFVPKGLVLAEFSNASQRYPFEINERASLAEWVRQRIGFKNFVRRSQTDQLFTKPLTVVINKNSASAAELVAASLKDLDRARIVGQKSYGKNTVQLSKSISGLESVNAMLTVYEWNRPSGGSIRATKGIVPDVFLEL